MVNRDHPPGLLAAVLTSELNTFDCGLAAAICAADSVRTLLEPALAPPALGPVSASALLGFVAAVCPLGSCVVCPPGAVVAAGTTAAPVSCAQMTNHE